MEITEKKIKGEIRYFAKAEKEFDGTARGYGFKSKHSLHKAYAYFKNKDKYQAMKEDAQYFLNENPDVKEVFDSYLSEQECFYRMHDREDASIPDLLERIEDQPEIVEKINSVKHLWKSIFKVYNF